MIISVAGTTVSNYTFGGTTAELRIFATKDFITSGNVFVYQGVDEEFYKSVACTVAGTTLSIPGFTIDSTTDATPVDARYNAWIYDADGNRVKLHLANFCIQAANGSVTWTDIELFSTQNKIIRPAFDVYTVQALETRLSDLNLLSGYVTLASDYDSLSDAVSAIGASGRDLVVTTSLTVTDNLTIPSTTKLVINNNATLSVAAGKTLSIGNFSSFGNQQCFSLGSGSHVKFAQGAVDEYNIAWWCGAADGTNATSAINEAIYCSNQTNGGVISIPNVAYVTDGNHTTITDSITIKGAVGYKSTAQHGSILKLSTANSYCFKVAGSTTNVLFQDITIDGNSLSTVDGVSFVDSYPNTTYNVKFERCNFYRLTHGVRINSGDNAWQLEQFTMDQCVFLNNSHSGFRCNTVNGSFNFNQTQFYVPATGWGMYLNGLGQGVLNGCEFAGLAAFPCSAGSPSTSMAQGCIYIDGTIVGLTIIGSQDEAFQTFLLHKIADTQPPTINLIGCLVQSPIKFDSNSNALVNIIGGSYFAKTFIDTSGCSARITAQGHNVKATDICGASVPSRILSNFAGSSVIISEEKAATSRLIDQIPRKTFQTDIFSAELATDPWLEILSTRNDKNLLRIGLCDSTGLATHYWNFTRKTSNGALQIDSDQTAAPVALLNPLTIATTATSLLTLSGTGTTSTLAINSTTGSPNASLSLQENGATKWQVASYNTGLFSIFNQALNHDALTITAGDAVALTGTLTIGDTLTLTDAKNVVLGSTTGTKIGTATTQKLAFFNSTPIVQPANSVSLETVLSNLGLRASGASAPLTIGTLTLSDTNVVLGTATGTQIGTATSQKLAFHGAAPVVQRAGAAQAAVATTGATNTTPFGFTTAAQADAIVTLVNELRAAAVEKGLIKGSA